VVRGEEPALDETLLVAVMVGVIDCVVCHCN
jgi:hypothetical protein